MTDWLTTKQAAERLGIDWRSIVKAIKRGKLAAQKMGRDYVISASEVERYRRENQRHTSDQSSGAEGN